MHERALLLPISLRSPSARQVLANLVDFFLQSTTAPPPPLQPHLRMVVVVVLIVLVVLGGGVIRESGRAPCLSWGARGIWQGVGSYDRVEPGSVACSAKYVLTWCISTLQQMDCDGCSLRNPASWVRVWNGTS